MPKKPRQQYRSSEPIKPRPRGVQFWPGRTREVLHEEFRTCDRPGCSNAINVVDFPRSFSGPIYCVLHRDPVRPE